MSHKAKPISQPALTVSAEVVRQIRQHARSASQTEICGVLIGQDRAGQIEIRACIAGEDAEEAGAHVTFTQDTWEHIYQVKDRKYPDERIVGWYHSHPGFGIFLSEHDAFIHKNFFASPGQVAWVFDPHSDEEGCFGWVGGRLERLSRITFTDPRGGEVAQESKAFESSSIEPAHTVAVSEEPQPRSSRRRALAAFSEDNDVEETSNDSLLRLTTAVFSYITALLAGFLISWYLFPRVEVVQVPVDPMTGKPLPGYSLEVPQGRTEAQPSADQKGGGADQSGAPRSGGDKENHAKSK